MGGLVQDFLRRPVVCKPLATLFVFSSCFLSFFSRIFFRSVAPSLCCQHGLRGGFSGGPAFWQGRGAASARRPDFVQLGRFPCDVALPCQRELQQRGCEGTVHCNCKMPRPLRDPCGLCCGPDGFGSKSAPNLDPNDHQAAATDAHKLGLRLALFTAGCLKERPSLVGRLPQVAPPRNLRVTGLTMAQKKSRASGPDCS